MRFCVENTLIIQIKAHKRKYVRSSEVLSMILENSDNSADDTDDTDENIDNEIRTTGKWLKWNNLLNQ